LWLAVNAAAVQEDEDQRGLAHFVEHMAFIGTKRFPKATIVNYLESIGVKFGAHLNASTSFDETIYKLQVPTDDPKLVDKGFDILRDWAGDVSFDAAEVDKERGVVMEEWRLGRGFQQRLLDKLITIIFGDSKYAKRLPIGLPDVIQKAPRERLVQFYKDWYRPDLMAVIAVGDFADTAAIEKQIADKFGSLPKADKPRPRTAAGVPAASGTRVAIETDKELPVSVVAVGNLVPHRSESTTVDHRRIVTEALYQLMLNERLQTIARKPDATFAQAGAVIESFVREVDMFVRFALVKGDDAEGALRSMLSEVLRIERHGFVQSELDRARTVMARSVEQSATEYATRDGGDFVDELVKNYLTGEFVVGPEIERDLSLKVMPTITLAELNAIAKSFGGPENRVIVVAGPAGKPMPDKAKVLALVDDVAKAKHEAWKDEAVATKLMEEPAWPGTVSKETKNDKVGTTKWMLANGVRVIVKPTDYERDAVAIEGISPGGLNTAAAKDFVHARFADEIVAESGVGPFDAVALRKALAGKRVSVAASIGEVSDVIQGTGSARDVETMLQLIHLHMTAPRKDEQAFGVWKTNNLDALTKQTISPDYQFQKKSQEALWQKHPRRALPEVADVKAVDLDKALAFYRGRFADASDFTFVIVGAVELDKLKPLVEAYLGSLPKAGKKEKEIDNGAKRVAGVSKQSWNLGQDQDKARVSILIHGDEAWSRDKERDMFILSTVASIRLREVLREDLGGVYGVGASGQLARSPKQERTFGIGFGCAPGAVDKLVNAAFAELDAIAKNGIGADYLEKVKQGFIRDRETSMRTNNYWVDWLARSARYGDDPALVLDPKPVLDRMTYDNVKAAAKRYLDRKKMFQAVMLPGK
ncbi:MAG: insulinase family protein, partial [Deltaproteobacteria bacterium]|nr:insulinase family protein [Deltaproteobacteria bacterium]